MSTHCSDKCIICGKFLQYGHKTMMCRTCRDTKLKNDKIEHWLNTGDTGTCVNTTIRGAIRDYILCEQNYKCAICGLSNIWNNKHLQFIMDHIDGDASNNCRDNLRLICPNCDSQLDTFKSKNKCSARDYRRISPRVLKGVQQIDINSKEIIATYSSVKEAESKTGFPASSIYNVANGFRKNSYGYIWKYI